MKNIDTIRHSLAHILASVIKQRYPKAELGIGPAIDNGFYYDFDFSDGPIPAPEDLADLEQEMKKLISKHIDFVPEKLSEVEAKNLFKNEPYKLELMGELLANNQKLSFYRSENFLDLCAGPHISNTKEIDPNSFKLERIAGAYWKGSEKNTMLTRIYGVAFASKEELDAYLAQIEEAKKRDHKKLGKELGLFFFSDLVGPGLPLYTFKGTIVRREIVNFSNELQKEIGYQEVHTPNMNKAELFKVSGHYEKYKEDMFRVVSNYTEEEYYLKPMNCPQHTQIYASQMRSYRDLPIRIADFANLYRDEKPGELSGLTRLRSFCQDDGHCFCREDQIKDEFISVLGAIRKALTVYKMDYYIRLSLWDPEHPEKYLGDPATWEKAQVILEEILKENSIEYVRSIGEAAIYGPKMDIMTRDSLEREWQISTIQLDLIMPERFGLTYIAEDGKEKTPVMIHRALVGSPERFMGIYIEHVAGNFPVWLAPVQVAVLPISEKHRDYAGEVCTLLKQAGIRAELNSDDESLGKKIRNTKIQKVPYFLVLGDKEVEEKTITVESRNGESQKMSTAEFITKTQKEINDRS